MRAMVLATPGPAERQPLAQQDLPSPRPGADEIVVAVSSCGVCRTDLHVVEADMDLPVLPIVPGHQIVGHVLDVGHDVSQFRPGDPVGIAWVNRFCGQCEYCISGQENLCDHPTFTGFHRDGGFAERAVAPAAFAHRIPDTLGDDPDVAPLLCAGIIGYRALKQSGLRPGGRLALFGFGASAHIALQIGRALGCEVFVVSRNQQALARARAMGAAWVGQAGERLPRRVDSAVSFAPAGAVIPDALESLKKGGTLAIAGVYVDRVPELDYERHLFDERRLVSVTANTRADARELLTLASRMRIHCDIETFPLERANEALLRLKTGRLAAQSAVLTVAS